METPKNLWEQMEEESVASGFWKPVEGKVNQVSIIKDPVRSMTNYKTGQQKPQYEIILADMSVPKVATVWSISAKGALQQIVAIVKANKLTSLVGAVLQIVVSGEGMSRKYVILPVTMPTPASVAQVGVDFPIAKLQADFPKIFNPMAPEIPKA